MRRLLRVAVALLVLGAASVLAVRHYRTRNLGPVQRGFEVAQANGCFTCHGPGGLRGMPNPGYALDEVPPLAGGLITMYAETEDEIREWILDGLPRRIADDPEQMKLRERALVRMPAWRGRIGGRDLDDLVAFVKAVSGFNVPEDEAADAGRRVADGHGCFNCHGPEGRGAPPNPGSLKGYIPSWDGADFPELARDDAEIREWIRDGSARRLRDNALARFFLGRQAVQMPAYDGVLTDAEIDRIVDYIRWLRRHPY